MICSPISHPFLYFVFLIFIFIFFYCQIWQNIPAHPPSPASTPTSKKFLFGTPPPPQNLPPILRNLLTDIFYLISTSPVLSDADRASLALNGPDILHQLSRSPETRLPLLERLEREFLKHVLCHHCGKFRRRDRYRYDNDMYGLYDADFAKCDRATGRIYCPALRLDLPFRRKRDDEQPPLRARVWDTRERSEL